MKMADGYTAYWNLKVGHALHLPTGEKEWVKILGIPLFKSEKWAMHKVLDVKNRYGAVVRVHIENMENGKQTILHRDGNTKVTAYLCEYDEPIKEGISMKKALILAGCVLVLGACDPPEYKGTPQGFKPIGQYEETPYRTIKLEDKETTCRYLITDDGYITPDLVQPAKCKGLMKGE